MLVFAVDKYCCIIGHLTPATLRQGICCTRTICSNARSRTRIMPLPEA
jgi:hypothetical protein